MNIYSNSLYIRNIKWDLSASSHSVAGQTLRNLVDSFSLVCSISALSIPIYYSDIQGHTNIVIILVFLSMSYTQNYYHIKFDLRQSSNHASLIFDLFITPENIKKQ